VCRRPRAWRTPKTEVFRFLTRYSSSLIEIAGEPIWAVKLLKVFDIGTLGKKEGKKDRDDDD